MTKFVRIISTLIITVGCAFFLLTCDDILNFPDLNKSESEEGTFSLEIGSEGASRTILPTTTQNSFTAYTLVFTPSSGGAATTENRTNSNLNTAVSLAAGTWSLTVTAKIGSDEVANGTLPNISITAGQNTTGNLALKPITTTGTGTFTWNIGYPVDVTVADMDIIPLGTGSTEQESLLATGKSGTKNLASGYYKVVFNLTNPSNSIVWVEYLHIYQNLTSDFTFEFTAGHFAGGVPSIPVSGVTLNKPSTSIAVGATETLSATVAPSNATYQAVTWSSDNEAVATVASDGTVTAVTAGTATITVTTTDGNFQATCTVTVSAANVPVSGVSLNESTLSLTVGGTAGSLTATVAPSNASNQNVSWLSSNTGVATVTGSGASVTINAVTAGSSTITVTTADGNFQATCTVTVSAANVPVSGVSLNESTLSLTVGGTAGSLTATVAPSNATNPNVSWLSSSTGVATVTGSGASVTINAVAAGSSTITVTTADGNFQATCNVTVTVPVTGVSLNESTLSLTVGGTAGSLTATVAPSNATNPNVSWLSSNTGVATITGTGASVTINAVAAGSSTITVTTADGNFQATCNVTVTVPVTGVSLNESTLSLTVGGTAGSLTATVAPSNASNQNVSWLSSSTGVATITGTGASVTINAIAAGSSTITVTTADGNFQATCNVTVSAASTGTITITFAITDSAPTIPPIPTLYQNSTPSTANLTASGGSSTITWLVDNVQAQTGTTFELKADDYGAGPHTLTVVATTTSGAPYNKSVSFTIAP